MTVELRAGVGDGRPNHRQDVALVQLLLNAGLGGVPIGVDGVFGPGTRQSLEIFQTAHFGFSDHVVDPGDITFKRLRGKALTAAEDTLLRVVVLQSTGEGAAIVGSEPTAERISDDGLGVVTTWSEGDGVLFIHSHPTFGTWEVRGLIAIEYQNMGEEAGAFGNPISGERDLLPGGGRVSWFERGTIEFRAGQGIVSTPAP
jgi:hypothetical protein